MEHLFTFMFKHSFAEHWNYCKEWYWLQTPMVVYLASIGSLISYKLGALSMIPPDPRKQVMVNSQRKSLSSTIAMYFQSSITSLSLSLFLMCWAMNWTPLRAISTSGLNLCEETESCNTTVTPANLTAHIPRGTERRLREPRSAPLSH